MAEQEIAKHGKQVIRLMTSKEHGIGHKLREIAIEFATILFAVLLSIWLHGWSEHRHQQHEVRTFLAGLKQDLLGDIREIDGLTTDYKRFDANFRYLAALEPGKMPDEKTFGPAYQFMDANRYMLPTKSRFDGFMMSGKLTNIEDQELLSGILVLYQSVLPQVQTSEGGWATRQRKLRDYRDEGLERGDAADYFRLLTTSKGKRLLNQMLTTGQHYDRYRMYASQAREVIRMIDAYPGMADQGHR